MSNTQTTPSTASDAIQRKIYRLKFEKIGSEVNLPTPHRETVNVLLQGINNILEEGCKLVPLIFHGKDNDFRMIGCSMNSLETLEGSVAYARSRVREMASDLVLSVMPCKVLPQKDRAKEKELVAKYGSISQCPKSMEILYLQLEIKGALYIGNVTVLNHIPSENRKQLAEVSWYQTTLDEIEASPFGALGVFDQPTFH